MSLLKIKSTLLQAYVDGAFGLSTAYENRQFEPTTGTPWAAVYVLPNQPSAFSLGSNGSDEHDGILQIDLNYPTGNGDGAVLAKADAIRAVFKHGVSFTLDSQAVSIRQCGRSGARIVDGYFKEIITINWTARTLRG